MFDKILELKSRSGTHSPSIFTMLEEIPELKIKVDACFLSNPYATELFLEYFKRELIDTGKINRVLEFYPSQSSEIAELLGKNLKIDPARIFVGNGAIEAIQAVLHRYVKGKLIVNIPTFSSYYEYITPNIEVVFYELKKEKNFKLDVDEYIDFVKNSGASSIVLINPNNPDGGYLKFEDISRIIAELSYLDNIIVDESFIHFAYESSDMELKSVLPIVLENDNVILVKSMSKDFGVAGLRCGYAVMKSEWVKELFSNGYLWNLNGLSEYFFRLYVRKDFNDAYEIVRKKYITESLFFIAELQAIEGIKVYPSKANFVLIELMNGLNSGHAQARLLSDHGVYVRNCSDKIGLNGQFIRVAARSKDENEVIVNAIKSLMKLPVELGL